MMATVEISDKPGPFADAIARDQARVLDGTRAMLAPFFALEPLGDRVIILPDPESDEMKGGIIVPQAAREKPTAGEIVALGLGRVSPEGQLVPMDLKVGDHVLYAKYTGTPQEIAGVEYVIVRAEDVIGRYR